MTRWWWVRHGPTHQKAFTGWRDVPADLSNQSQLDRLDAYLPRDAVLVSSDLTRARTTADCLATGRERLDHAQQLREFDFGKWDGLPFDVVAARDPQLSRAFWDNPGSIAPPDGESWDDVSQRVEAFVQDTSARFAGRDIIAVAHIGVIMTQLARISGGSPQMAIAQMIDPLSTTQIQIGPPRRAGTINHIP